MTNPATDTPHTSDEGLALCDVLSQDELARFTQRSDLMGFAAIAFTWAVIIAALALLGWASQLPFILALPFYLLGIAVIAGRQLALSALTHQAAHATLFKTPMLNEVFGEWLCARPIGVDLAKYRQHHLQHHARTNQPDDPDLSLIDSYPCSRATLVRQVLSDLTGLTGLKLLLARVLMDAGVMQWTWIASRDVTWLPQAGRDRADYLRVFLRNARGTLIVNAVLLILCALSGHPGLYWSWLIAYITPFPLFLRIRSVVEHACMNRSLDPFENSRTTQATYLARATSAPLHVNFHMEHHLLPEAPYFRLPAIHQLLRERGAVHEPPNYQDVFYLITSSWL